jgi:CRP/FNR family transcriptional regulator
MNWDKLKAMHGDPTEKAQITPESVPVFAPIVSDGFSRLSNLPAGVHIAPGTTLIEQSTRCAHVALLLDGLVKLVSVNGDGKQATIGLRTSGWYAGAASVLMDTVSVYSVIAVTKCTVVQIPADDFYLWLIRSARMMRHFISAISNEMISLCSAQAHMMSGTAEERLAKFMSEREPQNSPWQVLDALPLLKQGELAQLLAISPEHLSRLLHKELDKGCVGRLRRVRQTPRRPVPSQPQPKTLTVMNATT